MTVGADQVFESLAVGAVALKHMAEGVGRRGGVAALQDVDQQAGGIATAF